MRRPVVAWMMAASASIASVAGVGACTGHRDIDPSAEFDEDEDTSRANAQQQEDGADTAADPPSDVSTDETPIPFHSLNELEFDESDTLKVDDEDATELGTADSFVDDEETAAPAFGPPVAPSDPGFGFGGPGWGGFVSGADAGLPATVDAGLASDAASGTGDGGLPDDGGASDASPVADAGPPPPPPPPPLCPVPPVTCAGRSNVVFFRARDAVHPLPELCARAAACIDYHLMNPAPSPSQADVSRVQAGLKALAPNVMLRPRGGPAVDRIHADGRAFHALAEVHWSSHLVPKSKDIAFFGWSRVTRWRDETTGQVRDLSWYQKGVIFRQLMAEEGYDVARGDSWVINELPSTWSWRLSTQKRIREFVRGLYTGPPGAPPSRGTVMVIGYAQSSDNLAVLRDRMHLVLPHQAFWRDMSAYVRFWAAEAFVDPKNVCVGGVTTDTRSDYVNHFTEFLPRMAAFGKDKVPTAWGYLSDAYVPLLGASWPTNVGYGDTRIPIEQMERMVTLEVHATRAWAETHAYPDSRIAFAWAPPADSSNRAKGAGIATHLADAIGDGYGHDGTSQKVCSAGVCTCDVAGSYAHDALWLNGAAY